MSRGARRIASAAAAVLSAGVFMAVAAGCSSMSMPQLRWPWSDPPPAAPEPANALAVMPAQGATAPSLPQYWKRNTLVLDMQAVSGTGSVIVKPHSGGHWPVRLALRVMPGQVGRLEVQGEQRVLLPISAAGSQPVDLELSPGVYSPDTPQIVVRWSASTG